jgi:uncharacterized protein (DUF2062 family)
VSAGEAADPGERPGFWRRRVVRPLAALLGQGTTPETLALSLAVGLVLGLFPILGTTTLLCLGAGVAFRLNHVALQLANQLAWPLQAPLILAFVRLGEALVRAPRATLDPVALAGQLREDALGFVVEFGRTGLHGILGWSLAAPALLFVAYVCLRPLLHRLDAALRRARRPPPEPA